MIQRCLEVRGAISDGGNPAARPSPPHSLPIDEQGPTRLSRVCSAAYRACIWPEHEEAAGRQAKDDGYLYLKRCMWDHQKSYHPPHHPSMTAGCCRVWRCGAGPSRTGQPASVRWPPVRIPFCTGCARRWKAVRDGRRVAQPARPGSTALRSVIATAAMTTTAAPEPSCVALTCCRWRASRRPRRTPEAGRSLLASWRSLHSLHSLRSLHDGPLTDSAQRPPGPR